MVRSSDVKTQRRIGFISTRFAGTDGVSLETAKWAAVIERMGHQCFYFCGECDRPEPLSYVVPEAFYRLPDIEAITQAVFAAAHQAGFADLHRPAQISRQVQELKDFFKEHLYRFAQNFDLHALFVENALAIPLNLPLGLAITEFVAETGFPAIAHHHDFYWERQRFMRNAEQDYLAAAFPPNLPSIQHAVINSVQAQQLAARAGAFATVIPNVMDFDSPPPPPDDYASTARADLGAASGQFLILLPTRFEGFPRTTNRPRYTLWVPFVDPD